MSYLTGLTADAQARLDEVLADRSRPQPPARVARCGTRGGYQRHRRLGERACGACLDAEWNRVRTYRVKT